MNVLDPLWNHEKTDRLPALHGISLGSHRRCPSSNAQCQVVVNVKFAGTLNDIILISSLSSKQRSATGRFCRGGIAVYGALAMKAVSFVAWQVLSHRLAAASCLAAIASCPATPP